jgi:diguanylate cyclase (GGDEF)-like protein
MASAVTIRTILQAGYCYKEICTVISLKKYLDNDADQTYISEPDPSELFPPALKSYRSTLLAMGSSAARACAAVGSDLQHNLAGLEGRLYRNLTPALFQETGKKAGEELEQWGGRTADYLKARAEDAKELLVALARTAESLGERDQRYASHFTQFTSRLQAIANLEDLTQIRASLVQRATELRIYVGQMEQESRHLVTHLQAEVSTYETKLKAAEERALRDTLTGLANRRNVEERIQWRIGHQSPFCVAILDLNRFKQVNDRYGHPAGDSLLKQFSHELSSHLRSTDLVGRWSGDEFIVVLDCELASAKAQMERMGEWAFGDYTIQVGAGADEAKVRVDAAVGLVQWRPDENLQQVIERADAAMYKEKKLARNGGPDPHPSKN